MKILFLDNSTKLTTVRDLETRARGGMVTSLFKVSDYLSYKGHNVTVIGDIQSSGKTREGTIWMNINTSDRLIEREVFDAFITNRGVGDGHDIVRAKRRILWTHDLPHSGFVMEPKTLRAFDGVVFMSDYAERVWRHYFLTIGKSFRIPNGVDKKMFHPREKDLDTLIFASAPNRGLKRLPFIYEAVKARAGRPIRMKVYSNMKALHPNEVRNDEEDGYSLYYKECQEVGIDIQDPIPQPELAEELGRAGLMVMPTDYPEICSNVILQSLASGTPIVTTGGIGSAGEWIKHRKNGYLTLFQPVDYMIHTVEMVRGIVGILITRKLHEKMIKRAAKTKIFTWEEIGTKWDKMIGKLV